MTKQLLIYFTFFLFTSCNKYECIKTAAPEMIGDWKNKSSNNGFHIIYIQSNGRGHIWGENNHNHNSDTQRRGWYIKNDVLYFSRLFNNSNEEKFKITLYPTLANKKIILDFDSILIGDTYIILDDRYYKKIK